ncbi:hypothetical protein [Gemmobacter serpentinus]|uniref:hypothetical protein n=1 Tax=Gemmobacter serpentinus TaxID=2652247 RepID=UPI00124DF4B9|nr:hypothetical protein [Gemmobacter serpentinus]
MPGWKRTWLSFACLALLAQPLTAQARLGAVDSEGVLRVPLDTLVPLSRLRIEVDGVPVAAGLALSGRDLLVRLPSGLGGARHDLVVYRMEPGEDVELGVWSFETPTGETDYTMTGRIEAGVISGPGGTEGVLNGSGRIGFSRDGDRWRGSLGFLQTQESTNRNPRTEITDYFLEHRGAAFGDDLIARIGTQELPGETPAMDDGQRRGLSMRLQDPARRYDLMMFAMKPGEAEGRRNLTGLEEPDDLVSGLAAQVMPFANRGFQIDLLAFEGRAEDVPVTGQGMRLSGPIALLPAGSFELGYAQVENRSAAIGTTRDDAVTGELGFAILPDDGARSLSLALEASRIGGEFYSPLNPDLIADETETAARLIWQSAFWQWEARAARARNNIEHLPGLPTDSFRDVSFDLYFLPDDFTGGPLNGMTFYLSAAREGQRRLKTPAFAPAAEDFDLDTFSIGMDKFQPDYAWALGITSERLHDRTGRGLDERRTRLEALYAWTPDDTTTLTLSGELGQVERGGNRYRREALEAGFAWDLVPDLWSAYVEGGVIRDSEPGVDTGRFVGVELSRSLSPRTDLVGKVNWGKGAEAPDLAPDGGTVFGLVLRHDLGG